MQAVCRLYEDNEIGIWKQAALLWSLKQLKLEDMFNKHLTSETFFVMVIVFS